MRWITDLWTTAEEAIGPKRLALGTIGSFAVAGIHYLAARGMPSLTTIPTWAVWLIAALAVMAWWFLIYANKLRIGALPKLKCEFQGITDTDSGESRFKYVRIKVKSDCSATVKRCRGHLTNIQTLENGELQKTKYAETLRLTWATHDPTDRPDEIDIAELVPQYLDVCFSAESDNRLRASTIRNFWPNSVRGILDFPATYVFSVVVSTIDGRSLPMDVAVEWTGKWEKVRAWQL